MLLTNSSCAVFFVVNEISLVETMSNFSHSVSEGGSVCDDSRQQAQCQQRQHLSRYFYNRDSGQCEAFVWGGCEAPTNNFMRLDECRTTCENTCQLPKSKGDCEAAIPR